MIIRYHNLGLILLRFLLISPALWMGFSPNNFPHIAPPLLLFI